MSIDLHGLHDLAFGSPLFEVIFLSLVFAVVCVNKASSGDFNPFTPWQFGSRLLDIS